jgi:spermidine/putrescine transport system permease protein
MTALTQTAPAPREGRLVGIDWSKAILNFYMLIFFLYLFVPLLIMVLAAFNSNDTPSVTDWQGFTLDWFTGGYDADGNVTVRGLPQETRFLQGLWHSIVIALGVIVISIPLGLSGALLLTRLESNASTLLYTILVSPMLIPGIVLGVSTMIFWRDVFGVEAGLFTAMIAQSVFIASYCMLLFMARLQRQDRVLDEAAFDLGASSFMVFRRITLPFLAPTIATATVIAFLQSIENYNTTFFAIGGSWTLVTEIGARMRFGLSPVINAIGVIFVTFTVIAAVADVVLKRRAEAKASAKSN